MIYLAHQRILGQKVKVTWSQSVYSVATRQPCGTVSVAAVSPLNETVPHGRLVVLLKAIEWSVSVMHSIECPPSS